MAPVLAHSVGGEIAVRAIASVAAVGPMRQSQRWTREPWTLWLATGIVQQAVGPGGGAGATDAGGQTSHRFVRRQGTVVAAKRFRDEDGANAVEFALLLPVLLVILFGTMFGASLFNTQQTATQAAREGARFGATLPFEAFATTPMDGGTDWFAAVEQRTDAVLSTDRPLTRPGTTTICVRFYYEAEDGTVSAYDNGSPGCPAASLSGGSTVTGFDGSRVEVTVRQPARIELIVFPSPQATVGGTGIARYEPEIAP